MKAYKFWPAFLAASLSANSPLAMAAVDAQQKAAINQTLKERFTGNFQSIYQKNGKYLDDQSQSALEAWLESNGSEKATPPQVRVTQDKSGKNVLNFLITHGGKTVNLSLSESNPGVVDLNGTKVPTYQLQSIQTVAAILAKTDATYAPLAKSLENQAMPTKKRNLTISFQQFSKLTPIDRAAYLAHLRLLMESSDEVIKLEVEKSNKDLESKSGSASLIHSLFSPETALAAKADKVHVEKGFPCLNEGNASQYGNLKGEKRITCLEAPTKGCPVPVYGSKDAKTPYIVDRKTPNYKWVATAKCSEMSPLHPDPESNERRAQYRKIIEDNMRFQGVDNETIKMCFDEYNFVSSGCREYVEKHKELFDKLHAKAKDICARKKNLLKDQEGACNERLKRELELKYFTDLRVTPVNLSIPACEKEGLTWDKAKDACVCKDGREAIYNTQDSKYECPIQQVVITGQKLPKDKCVDENGKRKTP